MKKLRSDARWHTFTPQQQQKIQHWLFHDHLGYQATRARMATELGLTCALSTIANLYHYLAQLRADNAVLHAHDLAHLAEGASLDVKKLRSAAQSLIASRFFNELAGGGDIQEIARLGRLLMREQSRDIHQERLELINQHLEMRFAQPPSPPISDFKPGLTGTAR